MKRSKLIIIFLFRFRNGNFNWHFNLLPIFVRLLRGCLYLHRFASTNIFVNFWRIHFVHNFTLCDRVKDVVVCCLHQIPLSVSPVWLQLMSPILQAPLFFCWIFPKVSFSHTFKPFIYSVQQFCVGCKRSALIASTTLLSFLQSSSCRTWRKYK